MLEYCCINDKSQLRIIFITDIYIQNNINSHNRIKYMLKIEDTHKYRKGNNYSPFLYDLGNMTVRLKGKHLYLIFAEYATVAKTGIKKVKSYF